MSLEAIQKEVDRAVAEFGAKSEELKNWVKQRDEAQNEKSQEFKSAMDKIGPLGDQVTELQSLVTSLKSAVDEYTAENERPGQVHESRNLGRMVAESEEYQAYKSERFTGKSKPMALKSIVTERKTLTTQTGTAYGQMGALIEPQDMGVLAPLQLPLMLRDLFPVIRLTNSDTITFVEVLDHANVYTELDAGKAANATTITVKSTAGLFVGQEISVAPANNPANKSTLTITAIDANTRVVTVAANSVGALAANDPVTSVAIGMTPHGAQKPEANLLGFTEKSYTIGTMAHYMVAHRQTLQDIPQLEGIINNALVYGLKQSEEAQLLYGNGTAPNLTGLMNNSNIQNAGTYAGTKDTGGVWRFKHVRETIAKLQLVGANPSGIAIHPNDWMNIEMAQATDNRFIWAVMPAGVNNQEVLWRVPVAVTQAVRQGEFLMGDFTQGAYILDREDANVRFSDQHKDFFTANMVAILAEERMGVAVPRPQFFAKGSFA